jgi:hypothetical protein
MLQIIGHTDRKMSNHHVRFLLAFAICSRGGLVVAHGGNFNCSSCSW